MLFRSALFGVLMLWSGTTLLLPSAILAIAGAAEEEQRDLTKSQPSEETVSADSSLHRISRRVEPRPHGSSHGTSVSTAEDSLRSCPRGPDSRLAATDGQNGCGARLRC